MLEATFRHKSDLPNDATGTARSADLHRQQVMLFGGLSFGSIRIDELSYDHDVVIERRNSERIERTGSTPITWLSGSRSGLTLKVPTPEAPRR
jgi:hypothetical protein